MQTLIPEVDENKGSVELFAEILFQVVYMFVGLYIIHKIISYIPTYSKIDYCDFNVNSIILAVLVIILSLQTRVGEKSAIIYERLMDMINGKTNKKKAKKKLW